MKTFHYYLKTEGDENGKHKVPKTTVTLMVNGLGVISRGVAICNSKDNFNKKTGRSLSINRAEQALKKGHSFGKIKHQGLFIEDEMIFKGEFDPKLSDFETDLLVRPAA